jgi:hypothetical protein
MADTPPVTKKKTKQSWDNNKTDRISVARTAVQQQGPELSPLPVVEISSSAPSSKSNTVSSQQALWEMSPNVLHGYRSHTYNFTLSGLDKSVFYQANSPVTKKTYEERSKDLVVLTSAGKGDSVIIPNVSSNDVAKSMITSFNQQSPGRFDMFIDNVELETLFAFDKASTVTLPKSFRFDVFEPYSINGFVEALQVTAIAAGYVNYAEASFLLKMSFNGYPDGDGLPNVKTNIDKATRYFPIKIRGFQVDITEKGTRYQCVAYPYSDDALTDYDNRLQQSIQIQGSTISTVLENFMQSLTAQRKESEKQTRKKEPPDFDEYSIEFMASHAGAVPELKKFTNSEFVKIGQESQIFTYTDPQADAGRNGYSGRPPDGFVMKDEANRTVDRYGVEIRPASAQKSENSAISFAANTNITDCITAVIVGSTWHRQLLAELPSRIDNFGMVDYFSIMPEITNKEQINDLKNKPYQKISYIIRPYKVHYTRVPNYESQRINFSKIDLKKLAYRKYDYIYTGQNLDVLNFKIHFDNMFYEAIARAMGNTDIIGSKFSIEQSQTVVLKSEGKSTEQLKIEQQSSIASPAKRPLIGSSLDPTGSQPQWSDPYYILSSAMYNSVINSYTGMVRGELEILGDPLFLVMGGGNYKTDSAGYGITADGDVDIYNGQVFIEINFRNPDDVGAFSQGASAKFNKVSFSGVYMVTKVVSKFSGGVFKQRLSIVRMTQAEKDSNQTPNPGSLVNTSENTVNNKVVDSRDSSVTKIGVKTQ